MLQPYNGILFSIKYNEILRMKQHELCQMHIAKWKEPLWKVIHTVWLQFYKIQENKTVGIIKKNQWLPKVWVGEQGWLHEAKGIFFFSIYIILLLGIHDTTHLSKSIELYSTKMNLYECKFKKISFRRSDDSSMEYRMWQNNVTVLQM